MNWPRARSIGEMDCCNYVEAYGPAGHFYQQQHHQQQHYFGYETPGSGPYAGYDAHPIANGIETARYNAVLPPAYPPDYVYNPKEARLRKAMREQSRELTRRSILQNAIGRNAALPSPSPSPSTAFLEHHHQHHRFGCNAGVSGVSGTAVNGGGTGSNSSSLPMQSAERIPDGWFANTGKPPVHSMGRLNDWYSQNNGADPIERLQAMGTMHQQQRVLEKCKSQAAAAAATAVSAFSAPEYSPFNGIARDRDIRRTDGLQEYSDFADGQKWHPYQNGASPHQHPRTPHPSQMGGILHPSVQNTSHGHHGHALWGQFCHATQPHVPTMPRNVGIRGPRHAVFLRDHPVNRHCGFPEEVSRLPYASSKLEVDAVRTSYPPTEHQMPRMMESSVAPVVESPSVTKNRRDEQEETTRWDSSTVSSNMSLDGLVPTSTSQQQDSSAGREKPQEVRRPIERFEPKKKTVCKQPLPGFHQAFGSTEIGRFSRSEYFVSMVGESNSVETESNDVSREHRLEMTNSTAAPTAADSTTVSTGAVTRNSTASRSFESEESEEASFDESQSELVCPSASYCGQPSTPRWHSPHVGPIGSEI